MGKIDVAAVFGIEVAPLRLRELLDEADRFIAEAGRATIMYLNVHVANVAYRNSALRESLRAADLVYCDGAGVRLGARILGDDLPARMTAADFIWDLAGMCAQRGHRLFWVGGEPGVSQQALELLRERHPQLVIAGAHDGFFAKEGPESDRVIGEINAAKPDLVIVGLGTPLQELWVQRNRGAIDAPLVWCLGATADFVTGRSRRAPEWMLEHGLEWLHRLDREPRRLFKRYAIGNPLFVSRVLRERRRKLAQ